MTEEKPQQCDVLSCNTTTCSKNSLLLEGLKYILVTVTLKNVVVLVALLLLVHTFQYVIDMSCQAESYGITKIKMEMQK